MGTHRIYWRVNGRESSEWVEGAWAYEEIRHEDGSRERKSLGTQNRDEVAQYLAELEEERERVAGTRGVTVRELAEAYLQRCEEEIHAAVPEAMARSTLQRRRSVLVGSDPETISVCDSIGDEVAADLTIQFLREWRIRHSVGRSKNTVRHHLDALRQALWYGVESELIETNPVDVFLRSRRTRRTKSGVEQSQIQVIERLENLHELVAAAAETKPRLHGVILHALDAGLRVGEIRARRWDHHVWGRDRSDRRRSLLVLENHPKGGRPRERTKTGKPRRVGMSRRLRAWLLEERIRQGNPESGLVFPGIEPNNLRRELLALAKSQKTEPVTLLTLRHTYASHLVSWGHSLEYISEQLGNSPKTCRTHYARWLDHDGYVEPPRLEHGEIPADLLALPNQAAVLARG